MYIILYLDIIGILYYIIPYIILPLYYTLYYIILYLILYLILYYTFGDMSAHYIILVYVYYTDTYTRLDIVPTGGATILYYIILYYAIILEL